MHRIALFGYSGAGKTALFRRITGKQDEVYDPFKPNAGVGIYKDSNLSVIAEKQKARKVVYPEFEFCDFKGFPAGSGFPGNYFRNMADFDLIACIVNNFTQDARPQEEAASLLMELVFYDTERIGVVLESRKGVGEGNATLQTEIMKKGLKLLEEEKLLNRLPEDERKMLDGMELLTAGPVIACFNGGRKEFSLQVPYCTCGDAGGADDAEPLFNLIKKELSLLAFYTVKGDIARGWLVPGSYTARQAAGSVHKDMEKGFIKAAVVNISDFAQAGSWQSAKNAGTLKFLGPDSHLTDGDIVEFYFTPKSS